MPKKIEKTGVYRSKDGHAVYLHEGATPVDAILDNYKFDADATKEYVAEPETNYFSSVQDAPQEQKAEDTFSGRMVAGAPENKAMPAGSRTDAELADSAAKAKS